MSNLEFIGLVVGGIILLILAIRYGFLGFLLEALASGASSKGSSSSSSSDGGGFGGGDSGGGGASSDW
jgi:uncharacterized membrane protein YgcG